MYLLFRTFGWSCFDVFLKTIKPSTVRNRHYSYSDLITVPKVDDEDEYIVYRPVLIVEVYSPSTEKIDKNKKLREYSKIPSVKY